MEGRERRPGAHPHGHFETFVGPDLADRPGTGGTNDSLVSSSSISSWAIWNSKKLTMRESSKLPPDPYIAVAERNQRIRK